MKISVFVLGILVFLIGILNTLQDEFIYFSKFFTGIALMILSLEGQKKKNALHDNEVNK